jgi:hypothetical protein
MTSEYRSKNLWSRFNVALRSLRGFAVTGSAGGRLHIIYRRLRTDPSRPVASSGHVIQAIAKAIAV